MLLYLVYGIIREPLDSTNHTPNIDIIVLFLGMLLFFMLFSYGLFRHSCKREKRELFLELVGIDDERPYATIKFRWVSPFSAKKPHEIIVHRDIDRKQLLTLVAVSECSMYANH